METMNPVTSQKATTTAAPISAKREFEYLIRDIRKIVAHSRTFTGDQTQGLLTELESSFKSQKRTSYLGSALQFSIPAVAALIAADKGASVDAISQILQLSMKVGDVAQTVTGASAYDYQAKQGVINQALSQSNAFDQRMQSFLQTLDQALQLIRQQEMDQSNFR